VDGVLANPDTTVGAIVAGYGQYPLTADGDGLSPSDQVSLPLAQGMAVDARGFVYVYDSLYGINVVQFCAGSATPYRTYPNSYEFDFTVDGSGDLFEYTGGGVNVFAADSGDPNPATTSLVTPKAVIAGANTGLGGNFVPLGEVSDTFMMAADAASDLYYMTGTSILEFAGGANGNVAPNRTITDTTGGLLGVLGSSADRNGNVFALYEADARSTGIVAATPYGAGPAIVEYSNGQFETPTRVIEGASTMVDVTFGSTSVPAAPVAVAVDPASDDIYVLSVAENPVQEGCFAGCIQYEIAEFGPGQSGNVAPENSFPVAGTNDQEIAIDGNGNLAITTVSGDGILLYTTTGTFEGQIPVSSVVGLTVGVAYDANDALHVVSVQYQTAFMTTNGVNGLLTFAPPVTPSSAPSAIDPLSRNSTYQTITEDAAGETIAGNTNDFETTPEGLAVFAAGDTSGQPARVIQDVTFGYAPTVTGLAVDGSGKLYVGYENANSIDVLAPAASGNVTASAIYSNVAGSTLAAALAVDGSGNVYAASCLTNSISVFAPGQAGGIPTKTIIGPKSQLACPDSVAVDANHDIYTLNSDAYAPSGQTIQVFSAQATGDAPPTRTISPSAGESFRQIAIGPGTLANANANRRRANVQFPNVRSQTTNKRKANGARLCTVPSETYRSTLTTQLISKPPRAGSLVPGRCLSTLPYAAWPTSRAADRGR